MLSEKCLLLFKHVYKVFKKLFIFDPRKVNTFYFLP